MGVMLTSECYLKWHFFAHHVYYRIAAFLEAHGRARAQAAGQNKMTALTDNESQISIRRQKFATRHAPRSFLPNKVLAPALPRTCRRAYVAIMPIQHRVSQMIRAKRHAEMIGFIMAIFLPGLMCAPLAIIAYRLDDFVNLKTS